jgi:hypothetical protein
VELLASMLRALQAAARGHIRKPFAIEELWQQMAVTPGEAESQVTR